MTGEGIQWAYIKHKIGEYSRDFGAQLKKAKNLLKSQIENELQVLSEGLDDANKQRYADLKKQLDDIVEHEIRGSILRSLCKDYEHGEKCTKYFSYLHLHYCRTH